MQSLVFLIYFFKSYRRKTFGSRLAPPPPSPLVKKVELIASYSLVNSVDEKGTSELTAVIVYKNETDL